MTHARLALLSLLLLLLPSCAPMEPINGCMIAAVNRREVVQRAPRYIDRRIPARVLLLRSSDGKAGHAALVYRLDPEGFVCYDDTAGSRQLRIAWPSATTFPPALTVARQAFPTWPVGRAWWMTPAPR